MTTATKPRTELAKGDTVVLARGPRRVLRVSHFAAHAEVILADRP